MSYQKMVLIAQILVASAIAPTAHAVDLVLGLVSVHPYNPDKVGRAYPSRLDGDGVAVANPMLALRAYSLRPKDYMYCGALAGLNSVSRPMAGLMVGAGFQIRDARVGAVLGAYTQSNRQFRKRGVEPFSIYESESGQGVVPVTGMEIQLGRKYFTNVFLSPIVGNVGIGIRF